MLTNLSEPSIGACKRLKLFTFEKAVTEHQYHEWRRSSLWTWKEKTRFAVINARSQIKRCRRPTQRKCWIEEALLTFSSWSRILADWALSWRSSWPIERSLERTSSSWEGDNAIVSSTGCTSLAAARSLLQARLLVFSSSNLTLNVLLQST